MLNLVRHFEHYSDPFVLHLARGLLGRDQLRRLYETRPRRINRIVRAELDYEKQYAMNLLLLVENDAMTPAGSNLCPEWKQLLDELRSSEFTHWLEAGTSIRLRDLVTDVGIYTHADGDFISIHSDKQNKALTAILYLNETWPEDGGGNYETFRTNHPGEKPVGTFAPHGGQLIAFPPTPFSWHAVSKVHTGDSLTRLTIQVEFWTNKIPRIPTETSP